MHIFISQLASRLADFQAVGPILVAVSGGADSVALLRGLLELRGSLRISPIVGHVDHQIRGDSSTADAEWVSSTCRNLGIPCRVGRINVPEIVQQTSGGIEETARGARHEYLEMTARELGCQAIVLAHNADDQAETVLHHVIRGTGLAGLCGIPSERDLGNGLKLIRPMLEIERATILDYLSQISQGFREDESNEDESFTRNRIRRSLLPLLKRDFNPQVTVALRKLGRQAAETYAAIDAVAEDLLERVVEFTSPRECRLKWQPLTNTSRHLIREMFSQLWKRQKWARQGMNFDHWNELARICNEGGAIVLPGKIEARRDGRLLILRVQ